MWFSAIVNRKDYHNFFSQTWHSIYIFEPNFKKAKNVKANNTKIDIKIPSASFGAIQKVKKLKSVPI